MTDAAFRAAAEEIVNEFVSLDVAEYDLAESILRRHLEPKWTRTKPTEPGFYFRKVGGDVWVTWLEPDDWDELTDPGLLYGPLPPPAYEGERDADHD